LTRGRHTNHALLIDATGTEDATDLLARIIARPANGESALAVQARLHHAFGLESPGHREARLDARSRPEPSARPGPGDLGESTLKDQIRAAQQRLDQLQRGAAPRAPDRSLGL
jgi:hypothetical protein